MKQTLTRRDFMAVAGATAATLAAPSILRAQDKALRILTWEGYAEPDWVEPFKQATGASVNIVYTGSVDEMFAKMQGSKGADFDVVAFDTSSFARYIDGDLIQPLDMAKIANAQHIVPSFQKVEPIMRGDKHYGVPFAWGSLPLVYDTEAFPSAPESWAVMWDEQYVQQMIALDDANNSVVLAALVLGLKDPYKLSDDEFNQVKEKLIAQKKLLLTYYAGFDDGVNIFAQNKIKLMFSMGEPQVPALQAKGVKAALTIPKEGAIGWLDCWVVSAGAKDVDLAHQWINACLDKKVGNILTTKKSYGNTTDDAANKKAGMTYGDRLSWLLTPENFEKRVALWNEVKAS
ncbi:extracellular solute-binding protein [Taklimakanibacter deserti]|uniref:extracellular solute-binding protein n=1 Tax=Taklimakanibacter deserti TaxID=2267839 RepID=UPI000E65485C